MKIKELVNQVGVGGVLIMIGMQPTRKLWFVKYTSSNDDYMLIPTKITEERYKVKDGYKITLKPIYPGFSEQHFYQSDLELMIENKDVKIFINISSIIK